MTRRLSISFVGDVLTRPLGRLAPGLPEFEVEVSHREIDQIYQVLAGSTACDVLIVHTSSDFFLEEAEPEEALQRMDDFSTAVSEFASRNAALLILNTIECLPARMVGSHHLDELELIATLDRKIFDLARRTPAVSVVDARGIVAGIGTERALSMQNRLVMRMPYTKPAAEALSAAYAQAILERFVARKKVIVVDADNTLWGGIVGEDGVDGIAVEKQYPGTIYRRFQQQLLDLSRTGVLLSMVSKNNPADVDEVFEKRDMPLRKENFASIQVNWMPKSDNITQVANDLNVGLDAIIFIDDNRFEIEQVKAALPEVDVYWFESSNADAALGLLSSIEGLKTWSVTDEDRSKTEQYRQERQRAEVRQQTTGLEDYLRSLDIRLEIGRNRRAQIKRISQLTNKTNQFNLTTRRYSEADISRLMDSGAVFDVRLQDRFGDMGIIGVVIVQDGAIDTFLISCRALGRGVETKILEHVCRQCAGQRLMASYAPTRKNMIVAEFYEANSFELVSEDEDGRKTYRLADGPRASADIPVTEVD